MKKLSKKLKQVKLCTVIQTSWRRPEQEVEADDQNYRHVRTPRCLERRCHSNCICNIKTAFLVAQSMSMSIKYLYSANSRRSNLRRWRVSD